MSGLGMIRIQRSSSAEEAVKLLKRFDFGPDPEHNVLGLVTAGAKGLKMMRRLLQVNLLKDMSCRSLY